MSEHIPFEIQEEIMRRLPVRSLLQFRSVSKSWRSLIDSADFIAGYSGHRTQPQRLLVNSRLYLSDFRYCTKTKYVSIVDDHTLSQHKVYLPKHSFLLYFPRIISSSHGLLCLYGYRAYDPEEYMAALWNISIRKVVALVVPNVVNNRLFQTDIGFGVCRETKDPKILKITHICRRSHLKNVASIPRQVEVFTLSTGVWRTLYSTNLPRISIHFEDYQVVIEGFLYWLATDWIKDDGLGRHNLIISFDLTSEEFIEVNLPESLAQHNLLSMFNLRESLVLLQEDLQSNKDVFTVWMMEDRFQKLFTKKFTFNVNRPDASSSIQVHGFRKSGEPIIEYEKDNCGQLVVYEPCTKHIDNLAGMNKRERSFNVYPYMETLLLLDKPDYTFYNERGTLQFEDGLF